MTINELSGTTTPAPSPPRRLMVTRRAKVRLIRNVHTRCVRAHRAHAPLGARRVTCSTSSDLISVFAGSSLYHARLKERLFSIMWKPNVAMQCGCRLFFFFFARRWRIFVNDWMDRNLKKIKRRIFIFISKDLILNFCKLLLLDFLILIIRILSNLASNYCNFCAIREAVVQQL